MIKMNEETFDDILLEAFEFASPKIQELIKAGGLRTFVADQRKLYPMSPEVSDAVTNQLLLVLLGISEKEELAEALKTETGLSPETAEKILTAAKEKLLPLIPVNKIEAGTVSQKEALQSVTKTIAPSASVVAKKPTTPMVVKSIVPTPAKPPVPVTKPPVPIINRTPPAMVPRQVRTMQTDLTKTQPQTPKAVPVTPPATTPPTVAPVMIFKPVEPKPVVRPVTPPPVTPQPSQSKEEPKKVSSDPYREPIE